MNNNRARFLLYAAMAVFFLMVCVWVVSGRITKHYLTEWLIKQGADTATIESITFNPFTLSVELLGLKIQKSGHPLIELKKAYVDFSIFGLFRKELRLSEADIRGIRLDINQQKGGVEIGGFSIPAASDKNSEKTEEKQDSSEWKVRMMLGSISDSGIRIITPELESRLVIKKFFIWETLLSPKMLDGAFKFSGKINDSLVNLDSRFTIVDRNGTASCKVSLKDLELGDFQKFLPSSVSVMTGKLSITSEITADMNPGGIELSQKGKGGLAELKVESEPFAAANDISEFQTHMLVILKEDKFSSARGNASFSSKGFQLRDTGSDFTLVKWKEAGAEKIEVVFKEKLNLEIQSIHTAGLVVSSPPGEPEGNLPLLLAENFSVNNLSVQDMDTSIGSITITDMESNVHIDKEKKIVNLPEISTGGSPEAQEPDGKTEESDSPDEKEPSGIQIGLFEITGNSRFNFIDDSTDPGFRESLTIDTMEIRNLDNKKPDQESPFILIAGMREYGKIEVQGVVKPFAPKLYLKVDNKIAEYPLPAVSSYSRNVIDYNVKSGSLNAETSLEIDGDKISGKTHLKVYAIKIEPHAADEVEKLTKQVTMPLHVAVDYLTDKDGNFELEVPISGSFDDPSFGLSHFFQIMLTRAATSAAFGAMKTAILPYVALASQVTDGEIAAGGDFVKPRLGPVFYNTGKTLPEIRYDTYVMKLSELMKKEKKIRIILCGVAIPADIEPTNKAQVNSEETERMLLSIAEKRANDFKKILVEKHHVPPDRILECHPTIDRDDEAKPRLEIEL